MKSRSHHRLPLSEPHHNDDWGDGSWTVDCICGVNFDDGEEMVNCDECGVWVHTRCTRYVKSEKSFACDKCKGNKNSTSGGGGGVGGIRNDSEETEVAEFLVALPTKTLLMESTNPSTATSRRPFRLWTDIPMEERVHVQGVPGGEPGMFSGIKMSPVFGPELWKCAGYVPKKFNFRYREFPFLGDGEVEEAKEEDVGKRSREGDVNGGVNGGAGVLCSLLKEDKKSLPVPVTDVVVAKCPVRSVGRDEVASPKQKKWDGKDVDSVSPEDGLKNKSTSVEPTILRFAKRKKDESGMSKDQCVKKKVRTTEKEGDIKDQTAHASKAGRGSKAVDDDTACGRDILGECATKVASSEREPEATPGNDVSSNEIPKEANRGDQVPGRSENFSNSNDFVSLTELNGPRGIPVKEKVQKHALQSCVDIGGVTGSVGIDSHDKEPVAIDVTIASAEAKEIQNDQHSDEANSRPKTEMKAEVDVDNHGGHNAQCLPVNEVKLDTIAVTAEHQESSAFSEEGKVIETPVVSSEAGDCKGHDGSRSPVVGSSRNDRSDESPRNTVLSKQEPTTSDGSLGARKKASELGHGSEVSEKLNKSSRSDTGHHTVAYQRKVVVSMGKSASTSGGVVSKSSNYRIPATAQKPSTDSRQKESSERSTGTIRDNTLTGTFKDIENSVRPRKIVKEPSKLNSLFKTSQSTKSSDTSDSKRVSSDAKDSTTRSSSKVSSEPVAATTPDPGECVSQPLIEGAPHVQNKAAAPAVPGKGEKSHQSGSHVSSRGNVASTNALPSSSGPATLSDEELALLLHQELNSSPRVPRVPRMRNAGSLPQLTSPTATSMLMKRTSTSGGKDHSLASRKRTKDFAREGSHSSLEADNQPNKPEWRTSSPDNRKRDSGSNIDQLSRREADGTSIKAVQQNMVNVGSSVSSSNNANGHKFSSSQPSSRKISDEDAQAVGRLTNHTLPGLIAEIMSEGKRMTYEELCNAVLPHWPHLRKHNGERYAYTSHSQAVLDCLRNRSEWARLVDRGPKTSASRKRRKQYGESLNIESEDSDDNRLKKAKDVGSKSFDPSHQEDFPKGKRKARKRRPLALPGRSIVRRRRRADVVSDDESESSDSSEEESASSEEEIQGSGASVVRNEASGSSDDSR